MYPNNYLISSNYDIYDEDSRNTNYDQNHNDSDGDTDDASETQNNHKNYDEPMDSRFGMEIKEQMYQDKLANLKKQLEELKNGTHNEYLKKLKKLEHQYKERLRLNDVVREYLMEGVERDYSNEKKAAVKEYEEKKADLKENLLTDFEDRRKIIETERHTLELTSDSTEIKPTVTRKLRRRPNEPVPVVEKRRKPTTGQLLAYLLDEKEIESDLKIINRAKQLTPTPVSTNGGISTFVQNHPALIPDGLSPQHQQHQAQQQTTPEIRIEDGKLLYERRWFHRGQPVFIEGKDMTRFAATISAIGNEVVWVKKLTDNSKFKINMSQLIKGKISIKRRAN